MKKSTSIIIIAVLILVVLAGFYLKPASGTGIPVIVHKSLSCGCCEGFISELRNSGYKVTVKIEDHIKSIKDKYKISTDMESCHTSVIDGYFLEGHVPLQAIEKLMTERPEIDGIGVPGMPAGVGGMSGNQIGEIIVYAITDGQATEYMRI